MKDFRNQFEYVGFWMRVWAAILDAVILLPLTLSMVFLFGSTGWAVEHRTIALELALAVLWIGLYMWCVMRFGGTPGKLIVGIRIVDAQGQYLNFKRALRRELVPNILLNVVYLMQMYKALSTYPESAPRETIIEIGTIINDYGQPFTQIATLLGFLVYLDIGMVLFSRKKQALHDLIAGSFVITKRSYLSQLDAVEEVEVSPPGLESQYAE